MVGCSQTPASWASVECWRSRMSWRQRRSWQTSGGPRTWWIRRFLQAHPSGAMGRPETDNLVKRVFGKYPAGGAVAAQDPHVIRNSSIQRKIPHRQAPRPPLDLAPIVSQFGTRMKFSVNCRPASPAYTTPPTRPPSGLRTGETGNKGIWSGWKGWQVEIIVKLAAPRARAAPSARSSVRAAASTRRPTRPPWPTSACPRSLPPSRFKRLRIEQHRSWMLRAWFYVCMPILRRCASSSRVISRDGPDLAPSQVGLTFWDTTEKEVLYKPLARLGSDDHPPHCILRRLPRRHPPPQTLHRLITRQKPHHDIPIPRELALGVRVRDLFVGGGAALGDEVAAAVGVQGRET